MTRDCIRVGKPLTSNARTVYALTTAMLGVMIYELAYNGKEQGNPFSFKVRALIVYLFSSGGGR